MTAKIRVATTWLQGCAGCHMSMLDMHQSLIDLFDLVEIKYSPIVDAKKVPQVDVALIEGAVANDENEKNLKLIRENAKVLIALGTCASDGGITGFRNLTSREKVLACGYIHTPTTVDGKIPSSAEVPRLNEVVKALHQVVHVDYTIPGCPPPASTIKETLLGVINGNPPKDKTHNLCEGCNRTKDQMLNPSRDFLIDKVVSVHELDTIHPGKCFLEQGVLCMGPATREGCGALCPKANMPCRGCQGPPHNAPEQGAKLINCLSSLLPAGGLIFQEDIEGMGCCFSMPVSMYPNTAKEKGADSHE